ncbi:MAG: ABC transporter permease [Lachnospiraceae bacterium]|nr:ABC transporter permease [Lachnospiraceae bacterium]
MNHLSNIPEEFRKNRKMVLKLAKNDFRTKFAGSYLGIIWAFIQPVVTVLVYWFVFEIGFRDPNAKEALSVPFLLYLVAGIVPWFFFQDALTGGTNSMLEYSYLVKKVVFKISVLPVVKIISAMFVHIFFVCFIIVMYMLYGHFPDLYYLQIFYYSGGLAILILGLCYVTCSVVVFFRDLSQMINIALQVGIWMTPIMWIAEDKLVNHRVIWNILKLNPVYYVVTGYRDAFINKHWFWERPLWTLYFWCFTFAALWFGRWVFGRLRVHFADVL